MNHSLENFFPCFSTQRLRSLILCGLLTACGPMRPPIPQGTVPEQTSVSAVDEQYGQAVLNQLLNQYQLDRSDARIQRVRDIVARLTETGTRANNPWHTYVLADPTVKNAAATRGNYIFIWSALVDATTDDDELATVLAHEIGHVLAGHTQPTPREEVNEILATLPSQIARQGLPLGRGSSVWLPIAEVAISTAMEALLVNPEAQRKEFEADHIGLFLMADSGIDPEKAINFWRKAKMDPSFQGSPIEFLSTHPSSENRIAELQKILPSALERYKQKLSSRSFAVNRPDPRAPPSAGPFRRNNNGDRPTPTNPQRPGSPRSPEQNPFVYR